jgi:fimbrial chaperone protein
MNNSAFIKNGILKSFFASTLSLVTPVMAQATFLIWPIYPKIEANEKATAVWLQIRVRPMRWCKFGCLNGIKMV